MLTGDPMVKRDTVVRSTASALRQLIVADYAVGDRLPNEKLLAEQLEVSRGSVREALGTLEAEGAVKRAWGVGTFVSEPSSSPSLSMASIESYRDRVRAAGRDVELREAAYEVVSADGEVARRLRVDAGEPIWRIYRLFAVDGAPSAHMTEHVPMIIRGQRIDPSAMTDLTIGLFDMLDQHVRGIIAHAFTDVEAIGAPDPEATALGIPQGSPVLRTEQITTDAHGEALAFGVTLQRTDVLRMRITR